MTIIKMVLLRHGESQWNQENRFTGWYDIDLSNQGQVEAKAAGKLLKQEGLIFNYAFTSVLKRAIHTLWILLDELDQAWLPIEKSWKLNERHYGRLQGMNKLEMIKKYGIEKVQQWRRGFSISPPALIRKDEPFSGHDLRYKNLTMNQFPLTESLLLTSNRVISYWKDVIQPLIQRGECLLIVSHGNSLRALIKYLDKMSESEIMDLNIPTGVPIVYEFDINCNPTKHYYIANDNTTLYNLP
ncbi:MAG: 2,3-diphosphoglycerate-dependent phosphoglycerate mutase [Candidatus Dasytiphilus stammeri]